MLVAIGASVLVADPHTVGGVATRNTTAKISALQGTTYDEIVRHRGTDVAAAYAAAQLDAAPGIRTRSANEGVECRLVEAPAFPYATEPDAAEVAHREHERARAAG